MEKCAQLSDVARLSVEPGRRAGAVRAGGAAGGPGPRHRGSGRRYHPGAQVQLNSRDSDTDPTYVKKPDPGLTSEKKWIHPSKKL